ncbi:MAG: formyltransferase [Candidatus Binatia bacterium]
MRSVVFAYHDIGHVCLRELFDAGATVAAVITHDDNPAEAIWFRSVRELAEAHGVPVFAPDTVNTPEWVERIARWRPDFLFSFYFRKLLSNDILALPAVGALNLHGSLLPRYRGRCPVNWVLIHDERETGVTLHYMVEKADRGDIVAQRAVPITDEDTALTLFHKLAEAAAMLMRETYPLLCAGRAPRRPQDRSQASYFGGRKPEDGRIAWAQSARSVFNLVRAVTHPYPGAFTTWQGRRLYVWEATAVAGTSDAPAGTVLSTQPALVVQTGAGPVRLHRVQPDGAPEMLGSDWARRYGIQEGVQFV